MTDNKKIIVYIDGFNLYYGIRSLGQSYKWLNVEVLANSFVKSNNVSVKYFTAKLNGNNEDAHRQTIYLDALNKCCLKTEIIMGYFKKAQKCKNCDSKNNEEKQTDVNIACEIMQDCYENNFDVAYLVSGDSDLASPVKKTLELGKTIFVHFSGRFKGLLLVIISSGN
jgi:uncharacterized LabA/DUF88 family protein